MLVIYENLKKLHVVMLDNLTGKSSFLLRCYVVLIGICSSMLILIVVPLFLAPNIQSKVFATT